MSTETPSTIEEWRARNDRAVRKVKRWRLVSEVLAVACVVTPWLLAWYVIHNYGHGMVQGLATGAYSVALLLLHRWAHRRKEAAIDAHPLAFLYRIKQEFGT